MADLSALRRRALSEKAEENARLVAGLSNDERAALRTLRVEARHAGTLLSNRGIGGLPPSLVLGVMRRDGYACKVHGDRGEGDYGGMQIHHKGGLENPTSRWLAVKGHSNDPNNLVTLCARAHDEVHARDRAAAGDAVDSPREA